MPALLTSTAGGELLNRARFDGRSQHIDNYWDGDANRVQLGYFDMDSTYTWKFVYDVTAGIPAVVKEITPTATIYYYREPGGELLARQEGTTGSTRRYYHFDGLGSTSLLTNTNGDWTDKYSYDGWGNLLQHSTATGSIDQPYQYVGQLGYYTHYMVPGYAYFRLLQLGVRFYDPQVGRFTQVDPAGDGQNWYAYAGDDPLVWVDPDGLAPSWYDFVLGAVTGAIPALKGVSCGACVGGFVGYIIGDTISCMRAGGKLAPCVTSAVEHAFDFTWGDPIGNRWQRCGQFALRGACDTCAGGLAESIGAKLGLIAKQIIAALAKFL